MKKILFVLFFSTVLHAEWIKVPPTISWLNPVTTSSALPATTNNIGDCRLTLDTDYIYCWTGSAWVIAGGGAVPPGANLTLSNLTSPTAVNQTLNLGANNIISTGLLSAFGSTPFGSYSPGASTVAAGATGGFGIAVSWIGPPPGNFQGDSPLPLTGFGVIDLSTSQNQGYIMGMRGGTGNLEIYYDDSFGGDNVNVFTLTPQGYLSVSQLINANVVEAGVVYANNASPPASAVLGADSTTQGFLQPRMTTTQKNAISSPAEGLEVYDQTLHAPYFFNGTTWVGFGISGPGSSTNQAVAAWNGTGGSALENTNITVDTTNGGFIVPSGGYIGATGGNEQIQFTTGSHNVDIYSNGAGNLQVNPGGVRILGAFFNGTSQTTLTGSAGTAVCSQPEQGASYKKVLCYLSGYTDTGTQTYTFNTAFSHTPYVYGLTAGVAGATVTTTTATFTVTTQTGFVFAEGY